MRCRSKCQAAKAKMAKETAAAKVKAASLKKATNAAMNLAKNHHHARGNTPARL